MKAPHTAALRLAAYAAVTFAAVSITWFGTKSRIDTQQQNAKIAQFREINPAINPALLERPEKILIDGSPAARYTGQDGSTYYQISTHKGYNGEIKLLIGIAPDRKTLRGVRVLAHKETPGLGDKIDARIHPWIKGFHGKSLENTRFAVKKDGGDFDAFVGATITPRAVVNQVGAVLRATVPQEYSGVPEKPDRQSIK